MKRLIIICIGVISLVACNNSNTSYFPSYKLTIPQGNNINPSQLAQLQVGLNKYQVRELLGPPLLTDPFHANTWNYVYMITKNGVTLRNQSLNLYFENDELVKIEKIAADKKKSAKSKDLPKVTVATPPTDAPTAVATPEEAISEPQN